MKQISRRLFVGASLAMAACAHVASSVDATNQDAFICPPCGCAMDDVVFDAPGTCPDCGMGLVPESEHSLGFMPEHLETGAGNFELSGATGHEEKRLTVHYYMPVSATPRSDILIVIPGAGRNSDDYRNAWLSMAQAKNIIVAAIGYPEEDYDFAAYQLGGIAKDLQLIEPNFERPSPNARVLRISDENIKMNPNPNRDDWIFSDFDRVFDFLVERTGSSRTGYDIFGHSAGGQILHRLAVFHPSSKAKRIIAGNAGFYTLPDQSFSPPSGVSGTGLNETDLAAALGAPLTLLLGENDNSDRAGGTLLRTPLIDTQGTNRFDRGHHFFEYGKTTADRRGLDFNWHLETVPGVGHDYRAMSRAAGKLLYNCN